MTAAIDERLNDVAGSRADLFISDSLALDQDTVYAMLTYAAGLPAPTSSDIVEFVGREFEGRVTPVLATARHFVDHNSICVMLAKYAPSRPLQDSAAMHTVVAGARYLDVEMRDTWDVSTSPDGQKFLRRTSDDDVAKMVADRKIRMADAGTQYLTVANALGAGLTMADVGDIVRCYHAGSVYSDCEIKSVVAHNRLSVKIPHVGVMTIDRAQVVEVQCASKAKTGEMKKKLAEYFKKALPDAKYASELCKETTLDQTTNEGPSHWAPGDPSTK